MRVGRGMPKARGLRVMPHHGTSVSSCPVLEFQTKQQEQHSPTGFLGHLFFQVHWTGEARLSPGLSLGPSSAPCTLGRVWGLLQAQPADPLRALVSLGRLGLKGQVYLCGTCSPSRPLLSAATGPGSEMPQKTSSPTAPSPRPCP